MAIINSKSKQLSKSDVIMQALTDDARAGRLPDGAPLQAVILAIVQEMAMPNTETVQFGNTVFISHFSEDGQEVAMRALNLDTATNYVQNALQYGDWLRERKVKQFTTDFKDNAIRQLLLTVFKKAPRGGSGKICKMSNGGYRAYVVLGEEA